MRNAGLDLRDWHDPRFELPDKWDEVLKQHGCVVVVDPNGSYDIGWLQEQSALVVDASKQQFEASGQTAADRGELVSAIYTGLVPVVYKAQRTLLESLIVSTGWAFGMIAVVMIFVARSLRAGMLSMVPNVFPVLLVFGAMGWLSVAVDIGSMMTASVAMGVAVDDTIHFLTWFRRGLDGGLSRTKSILLAYERVGMGNDSDNGHRWNRALNFRTQHIYANAAVWDAHADLVGSGVNRRPDLPSRLARQSIGSSL